MKSPGERKEASRELSSHIGIHGVQLSVPKTAHLDLKNYFPIYMTLFHLKRLKHLVDVHDKKTVDESLLFKALDVT